jgi:hypothetical protein
MNWVCDIPGADGATSSWQFALHAGLAMFVVGAGILFLTIAVVAYRSPIAAELPDRRDA